MRDCLIKFSNEESHLIDFVENGHIYFNTAEYFTRCENEAVGQKDKFELATSYHQPEGASIEIEQLTLAIDEKTCDYTRMTRFKKGADTKELGGKSHNYPEEIYIVSGRLYDTAFDMWLEAGHFASRPPSEVHGPFICEEECLVLEVSYPSQAAND